MDISFDVGTSCFNVRTCAVMLCGENLLVMKDKKLPYAYLPGGRVKLNETAQQALIRELQEEIGIQAVIARPLWVTQAFFTEAASQRRFHEICFYFLVSLRKSSLLRSMNSFSRWEGQIEHRFEWVAFNELSHLDFQPEFVKTHVRTLPDHVEFILDQN